MRPGDRATGEAGALTGVIAIVIFFGHQQFENHANGSGGLVCKRCGYRSAMAEKEIWDKKNPAKKHKKMSSAEKGAATKAAKADGRDKPGLADNINAKKASAKKKSAGTKKVTSKKRSGKTKTA